MVECPVSPKFNDQKLNCNNVSFHTFSAQIMKSNNLIAKRESVSLN
jgi:hypothetical protein